MGANIELIAFRAKPNVAALEACAWLKTYRLFECSSPRTWFLEGAGEVEGISFFQPIAVEGMPKTLEADAEGWAKNGKDAIKDLKHSSLSVRKRDLTFALTLSTVTGTDVFYAFGNDDGLDCVVICQDGRLLRSRSEVAEEHALVIEPSGVTLEPYIAPDTGRYFYQIAAEEFQRFLGLAEMWLPSSDPYEIDQSLFKLVASKGKAVPVVRPVDVVSGLPQQAADATSLSAYLRIVNHWLGQCYEPAFIYALRERRDAVERALSDCLLYANRLSASYSANTHRKAAFAAINAHLERALTFVHLLRPKPEFRRSLDFRRMAGELRRRWWLLRLRLRLNLV